MATQEFQFNLNDMENVSFDKDSKNLTFEVNGQEYKVQVEGEGIENGISEFKFGDGSIVTLAELAEALNMPDFAPAAGPNTSTLASYRARYFDNGGNLLDGLNHLTPLDYGFVLGVQQDEFIYTQGQQGVEDGTIALGLVTPSAPPEIKAFPNYNFVKEDAKEVASDNIIKDDKSTLSFKLKTFDDNPITSQISINTPYGELVVKSNGDYEFEFKDKTPSLPNGFKDEIKYPYTIVDKEGNESNSTLTIEILGTNDAPIIGKVSMGFELGNKAHIGYAKGKIAFSDIDNGDILTLRVNDIDVTSTMTFKLEQNGILVGILTIDKDGYYTLVSLPNSLKEESANFEFKISVFDGIEATNSTLNIVMSINELNGVTFKPILYKDSFKVYEDGNENGTLKNETFITFDVGNVLENDKNALGETNTNLEAIPATIIGKYGTLTIEKDGATKYVLDNTKVAHLVNEESVKETFTYEAKDTISNVSSFSTITIDVHGRNDEATLQDSALNLYSSHYTRHQGFVFGYQVKNVHSSGLMEMGKQIRLIQDEDYRSSDKYEFVVDGARVETSFLYVPTPINGQQLGNASYTIPKGAIIGKYGWLIPRENGYYTYVTNYDSIASLTYREYVNDEFKVDFKDLQTGATNRAKVTFNIRGRDDAAIIKNVDYFIGEDDVTTNGIIVPSYIDTKYKSSDYWYTSKEKEIVSKAIAFEDVTILKGTYGYLELKGNGAFEYHKYFGIKEVEELGPNDTLQDTFDVVIHSPYQNVKSDCHVVITIQGSNDAPIATSEVLIEDWSGLFSIKGKLDAYDYDKGDYVKYNVGTFDTKHGTITINEDGIYEYKCTDPTFNVGVDRCEYKVIDSHGKESIGKFIIINKGPGHSIDVAKDDEAIVFEDSRPIEIDYMSNDNHGNELLTSPGTYFGKYGYFVVHEDGRITYQLDSRSKEIQSLNDGEKLKDEFNNDAFDKFVYKVLNGAHVEDAEIKVFIEGINDAPTISIVADQYIKEGKPFFNGSNWLPSKTSLEFTLKIKDVDNDISEVHPLQMSYVGKYGTLAFELKEGAWVATYTLDQSEEVGKLNSSMGSSIKDYFDVKFTDGKEIVNVQIPIKIRPYNDVAKNDIVSIDEDFTKIEIDYMSNDASKGLEGSEFVGLGTSNIANGLTSVVGKYGTLTFNSITNKMEYVPNDNIQGLHGKENVVDEFIYKIKDVFGYESTATIKINIKGLADGIEVKDLDVKVDKFVHSKSGFLPIADEDALIAFNSTFENSLGDITFIDKLNIEVSYKGNVINGAMETMYGIIKIENGKYEFLVDESKFKALGQDEKVVEHFDVKVIDESGNVETLNFNIELQGVNELPIVSKSSGYVSNGVFEVSGTIVAHDDDVNDVLKYSLFGGTRVEDFDGNVYTYVDSEFGRVKVYEDIGRWEYEARTNIDESKTQEFEILVNDGHENAKSTLTLTFENTNNTLGQLFLGTNEDDTFIINKDKNVISNFDYGNDKIDIRNVMSLSDIESIKSAIDNGKVKLEVKDPITCSLKLGDTEVNISFNSSEFSAPIEDSQAQAQIISNLITGS